MNVRKVWTHWVISIYLVRLVHGHLRGRRSPRLPSDAPPGVAVGLPAGDGLVRAHERRLPNGPARGPDRGGPGESGGGAGGHGALRQHWLHAGNRRHPGLDIRLPQRSDPRRRPGLLCHGPRGAVLPPLRPPPRPENAPVGPGVPRRLVDGSGVDRLVL